MDKKALDKITQQVRRKFPEMARARPSVKARARKDEFEVVYKATVNLPGGKRLPRVVRVIANASGKILRMSTSR